LSKDAKGMGEILIGEHHFPRPSDFLSCLAFLDEADWGGEVDRSLCQQNWECNWLSGLQVDCHGNGMEELVKNIASVGNTVSLGGKDRKENPGRRSGWKGYSSLSFLCSQSIPNQTQIKPMATSRESRVHSPQCLRNKEISAFPHATTMAIK